MSIHVHELVDLGMIVLAVEQYNIQNILEKAS